MGEPYFHTLTFCFVTNMLTKRIRIQIQPHRPGETCSSSSSIFFFSFLSSQWLSAWTRLENVRILVECHCTCTYLKAVLLDDVECLSTFGRASQWADRNWPGRLPFDMDSSVSFWRRRHPSKRHISKLEAKKTKTRKKKFWQLAAIVSQGFFSGWPPEDAQP